MARSIMLVAVIAAALATALGAARRTGTVGPDDTTRAVLDAAIDDERHAIAFYEAVLSRHGSRRPFSNIVQAERRHEAALLAQCERLDLPVPENAWTNAEIDVPASFAEACDMAIVAEIRNVALYDDLLARTEDAQVKTVFERLRAASNDRHLPAFRRHGSGWAPVDPDRLTPAQTEQQTRADAARDAMFAALLGRLTGAIESEGAAAAISICSDAAPEIAARIADEHGVRIGRTSWKLRNPRNRPPVWADLLVDDRPDGARLVTDRSGRLGVLSPIHLKATCLRCHGPQPAIAPDVKERLRELYPLDQATGFRAGELRGWFWVEVPPPAGQAPAAVRGRGAGRGGGGHRGPGPHGGPGRRR